MPTNTESLNNDLYRLLSKYKPKPLDAEGKVTPIPDEADVIKFEFTKDGEEYGTVYASIDEDRVLNVYFGDDVANSPDEKTPGVDYDDSWWGLYQQLSAWRMTKGLRGFKTQNKDRINDDMARRKHMRNKDKIAEGYYPMGRKASYSDAIPTVKIVIEHSRVIEEGEKRYRNINKIFLENQEGERYLLDTKKPGVARVYARHIAEGGKVNDDRWNHVHSLCEEYSKMAGFVRATRNGQFNESAQSLVNEGIAHYQSLRESLSRMTGKRGYNAYFENWTPALMETEGDESNLNELFVQETLDPRIESVMPILNRIHKKVSESVVDKEMNKLAEWADSLVEEESIKSNNPVGIPEEENGAESFGGFAESIDEELDESEMDENFINMDSQAVTTEDEMDEGTHTQHDRDLNPNDYERPPTDWSTDPIEAGTDRIHQKIASVLKRLSKPASKPLDKSQTDIGSVLEAALPWEDDDEEDKDDKKPKDTKGSDGSEHGGHSRAKHLAKNAIPKDDKEEVKEGQDELARILTIMNHRR